MRRILLAIAFVVVLCLALTTIIVERESEYAVETVSASGKLRALVLYHPSRDAHFSDDLSLALARGLAAAGFAVDRATFNSQTPPHPDQYAVIGIVSNTYFWTPDRPTLNYLERARLQGVAAIGIMGGAGATGRSERVLREAIAATGATVLQTRSFWLLRPNDESRMDDPNRQVAVDAATRLGRDLGGRVLRDRHMVP